MDEGTTQAIREYDVKADELSSATERVAFEFITEYARTNGGKTPDYRTVIEKVPDFYYREGVTDEFRYLAKEIKSYAAKRQVVDMFAGKGGASVEEIINKKDGFSAIDDLISSLETIKMGTNVRERVGTDLKADGMSYLEEYRDRKAGKSFRIWKSKFPTINEEIGGYFSGNMYSWYGRSGRGKSVFVMEEAIDAAMQGANVLVWAQEMSRFEWMSRAYASLSARRGLMQATIEGVDYEVGFENKALLSGKLTDEWEAAFESFLTELNEQVPGNIILRAADDDDFYVRSVKQLESDIIKAEAQVVVVDAIYHMDYEQNTSKTAGGDVANTSKKLRALAGRTKSVIHVITQADEIKDEADEDGHRELRAPKRAEVKKTKAVLEDCTNLFGIDSVNGQGLIEIGKSRSSSSEGRQIEVVYLPNYGLVKELRIDEALAMKLAENF